MSKPSPSSTGCPALTAEHSQEASSAHGPVSNSAIRNALLNVDILCEIFGYFDYAGYLGLEGSPGGIQFYLVYRRKGDTEMDIQRTRTLAGLARVCKAFSEPALKVLWSQLYSSLPLFRVLPTLCKAEENVVVRGFEGGSLYHLQDADVNPYHWDRIRTYAGYVRELYDCGALSSQPVHGDITEESRTTILRLLDGRPLFPNLQLLNCWIIQPETDLARAAITLSPSLRRVAITCDLARCPNALRQPSAWKGPLQLLIDELPERVPQLFDLHFNLNNLELECVIIPLSIHHPSTLRRLSLFNHQSVPNVGESGLLALTRLTALEELSISLNIDPDTARRMSHPVKLDFLASLTIYHPPDPNSVFHMLTSVELRSLTLPDIYYRDLLTFQSYCTMWRQSFPQLESFACDLWTLDVELDDVPLWPLSSAFEKLLSLPRMRKSSVEYAHWIPLTVKNDDLIAFARAWPFLETFSITVTPLDKSCLLAGLPGLHAFAENCLKLSKLKITKIDVRPEDSSHLPFHPPYPHHGLRTLDIEHGLDAETYVIVRKRLFPNLV
ncbi:hypothetical protein FKP32DRAFT_814058 [Trametes sanguinea]|nr:hypothetical protein FKP32DRAFT_814058 [Trametes sanguinea]